jgi:hypothetical protein
MEVTHSVTGDLSLKDAIGSRLEQRREEREQQIQRVREGRDAIEEQVDLFHKDLEPMVVELEQQLNLQVQPEQLDKLAESLTNLQKFVTDSGLFLPSYEVKKNQEKVNSLNNKFQEVRDRVKPKKKFGFKNSKNKSKKPDTSLPNIGGLSVVDCGGDKPASFSGDNSYAVRDKVGETVVVTKEMVTGKDVDLERLVDCRVEICGNPSTLHMSNIKGCTVLCGPTSTSILMDDCKESKLALSCQQLRIHRTEDTDFYLHTTSRAIIEDCSRVRFAPYSWSYQGQEDDFISSGLTQSTNNWNSVGDFNWLSSDKPSPNWSVIPDEERISQWQ